METAKWTELPPPGLKGRLLAALEDSLQESKVLLDKLDDYFLLVQSGVRHWPALGRGSSLLTFVLQGAPVTGTVRRATGVGRPATIGLGMKSRFYPVTHYDPGVSGPLGLRDNFCATGQIHPPGLARRYEATYRLNFTISLQGGMGWLCGRSRTPCPSSVSFQRKIDNPWANKSFYDGDREFTEAVGNITLMFTPTEQAAGPLRGEIRVNVSQAHGMPYQPRASASFVLNLARDPAGQGASGSAPKTMLRITTVDASSRKPVGGVDLSVSRDGTRVAQGESDERGGFFAALPGPGIYQIRAGLPPYQNRTVRVKIGGEEWRGKQITIPMHWMNVVLSIQGPAVAPILHSVTYRAQFQPNPHLDEFKPLRFAWWGGGKQLGSGATQSLFFKTTLPGAYSLQLGLWGTYRGRQVRLAHVSREIAVSPGSPLAPAGNMTLRVRILDAASGQPLSAADGAGIVLWREGGGEPCRAPADRRGWATCSGLADGRYRISAHAQGRATRASKVVTLRQAQRSVYQWSVKLAPLAGVFINGPASGRAGSTLSLSAGIKPGGAGGRYGFQWEVAGKVLKGNGNRLNLRLPAGGTVRVVVRAYRHSLGKWVPAGEARHLIRVLGRQPAPGGTRCLRYTTRKTCIRYKQQRTCAKARTERVCTRHVTQKVCVKKVRSCLQWSKSRECVRWKGAISSPECAEWKNVKPICLKWGGGGCAKYETRKNCARYEQRKRCLQYKTGRTCAQYQTKKACVQWSR